MTELLADVGSNVVLLATDAVLEMVVPPATPEFTLTTKVNASVCEAESDGAVQLIAPVPPTAGVIHVQLAV